MFDGFWYTFTQIAVLLVVAAALGGVIGWMIRSRRRSAPPAAPQDETRDELAVARQQVADLEVALLRISDEKDTEMGRLESGAISALDTTIASHQDRIETLEASIADLGAEKNEVELQLTEELRRTSRLQEALADRDARIAELVADSDLRKS